MKTKKVPKKLQGILWSVDINNLDVTKDKSYIINQILSLGLMDELRWLFKTYPNSVLKKTFIEKPAKIYTPSAFNYSKNILLNIKDINLSPDKYVKTLPRNIRS